MAASVEWEEVREKKERLETVRGPAEQGSKVCRVRGTLRYGELCSLTSLSYWLGSEGQHGSIHHPIAEPRKRDLLETQHTRPRPRLSSVQ